MCICMCCFGACNTRVAAFTLRPRVCVVDDVSLLVISSGLVINGAYASYTSYPYVLFVETNPVWLQTMSATQGVTITATISLTSGPTGVVLQYTDQNNYIYVMFDATARVTRYGTVYNGVFPRSVCHVSCRCRCRLPLSPAAALKGKPQPLYPYWLNIVSVTAPGLTFSWVESRLPAGSVGLISKGAATLSSFVVTTTCDSAGVQCSNAYPSQSCTFGCAPGYVLVAGTSATLSCSSSGWVGTAPICSVGT